MVYEFPELQGIMGKYYAAANGEELEVAGAIEEHYLPRAAGDILPTIPAAIALSIADKLDNVVGFFAVGIKPSGSQDPYALRRQALAIANIIINRSLKIDIWGAVQKAYALYAEQGITLRVSEETVVTDLKDFLRQRLQGVLAEKELRYDVIDAVLSADFSNISDTAEKALVLENFRSNPAFEALLTGYTRAANLAKKAENIQVSSEHLVEDAEKELYETFLKIQKQVEPALKMSNFQQVFSLISTLRQPIDNFFNSIMVMVDDEKVRNNRLALLAQISSFVNQIADLSKIVA
jgi:Glycyl-tRNA synthetase, beta subunit